MGTYRDAVKSMNKSEIADILNTLNEWEWDARLGEKPHLWDVMPNFVNKETPFFTRRNIIDKIMTELEPLTTYKEFLKVHQIKNMKKTRFQFEVWWFKFKLERIFTGERRSWGN